jgi:methionyl-tRNA synthetase
MDATFSEAALVNRYNSELANDLGNLFSRLIKLLHQFNAGKIPEQASPDKITAPASPPIWEKVQSLIRDYRLNAALDEIMAFVRGINKAVEDAAPWKSGKTDPEGTNRFLRTALEDLAAAACMLWPVMPGKMTELLAALGLKPCAAPLAGLKRTVPAGHLLPEKASLFPRIKVDLPADLPKPAASTEPVIPLVTIEDFRRIQLKVARIVSAVPVPGADKLLQLEIDLGADKRTLVAGIAKHYKPEDLPGKSVVIVANLQPTKIRGVESQGMLLAAEDDGKLILLTPESEAKPGSKIG